MGEPKDGKTRKEKSPWNFDHTVNRKNIIRGMSGCG
jgi:hypothetical protein